MVERSPVRTRRLAAASVTNEDALCTAERGEPNVLSGLPTESVERSLQILMHELREMREEQSRIREEFAEMSRRRGEECQQQSNTQLSPSINDSCREVGTNVTNEGPNVAVVGSGGAAAEASVSVAGSCVSGRDDSRVELGFKLKLDSYDGTVVLGEYFAQFDLIARANQWNEASRTVALASSLRGRARSVLESIEDLEKLNFAELKSKLELRFGERSSQNFYTLFVNRKQKFGEDFASFGMELERLARLAYPECSYSVRDKISCAQFVSAISDDFVKKTLQLEGVISLVTAIERAKAVRMIQEGDFEKKREMNFGRRFGKNFSIAKKGSFVDKNFKQNLNFKQNVGVARKECWQCGKLGHFRAECPSLDLGGQKN